VEFFKDLKVSASGMMAERKRLEVISNNIANINSPKIGDKPVFQAQRLVTAPSLHEFKMYLSGFRDSPGNGVQIIGIARENRPPRMSYEPGHPAANDKGYVLYPDINIIDEMVRATSAYRAYEANLTAFNETKRMFNRALEIGK